MRLPIFAVLLMIAGASALPQQQIETKDERIVTNQIRRAIEQIRREIRNAGLDPLEIDRTDFEYRPIPFVVIQAFVDQLTFTGASNIVINQLSFNVLLNRLRFTISLPELALSINDSGVSAVVFGSSYSGQLSGSLAIKNIRLVGEVRVSVGIISGINIRSLSLQFSLGGIESNLQLTALGDDYSNDVNELLSTSIPEALEKYRNEINAELEKIVLEILRQIL